MKLNPSPKIYNNYKCDFPEKTIQRIEEGFKKIGLKLTYHEKTVSSPDTSIYSGYALIDVLGSTQNGKGISSILSKASAYAEIAERFSTGFLPFRIPLPEKSAIYRKLLNDITERNFLKGYIKTNEQESTTFKNINKYFHTRISREKYDLIKREQLFDALVDAYSFIHKKYVKVPIHFIEFKSTSNGLSSGNTYEEAIAQAAFEIFERYAVNKIVFEKIICPTIDLKTIKNNKIQDYLKMFETLNIEVKIKDFTLKNTVPVIGTLFINHNLENDNNKLKKDRYYKRLNVGSHCNLYEAIIRCFTEYLQNTDTEELIYRKQSDILYNSWTTFLGKTYIGVDEEFKHFTRQYDYYGDFSFLEEGITIFFDELKCLINDDCLNDVNIAIKICQDNNWDFLVVDYTNNILQFPTIRIIIPPLSTDYDLFTRKCLRLKTFEERFNYFYGIEDLLTIFMV
jgi:YcaO-like protein with predicted kinase domain